MAKKDKVGHLNLFPTEFPNREIGVVIDIIRRQGDYTLRDQIEAAWWVAGYGASMIPDSHPPHGGTCTEEEMAAKLEECCKRYGGGKDTDMSALPWALFLPLLLKLAERLINTWLSEQNG